MNLVSNAIKFTEKGAVSVDINVLSREDHIITLKFIIKDTGIGIPHEKQRKIFESFIQADNSITRKYGGTGLGISIAKELVELMDGFINLDSSPGKGTTFTFTACFESSEEVNEKFLEKKKNYSYKNYNFSGKKVLLVEDYAVNRDIAKYYLEEAHCDVVTVEDGRSAVDEFKTSEFDLILMDIQMPILNGYEATKEIRKLPKGKDILIIGITANAFVQEKETCIASGMQDVIVKPFRRHQFYKVLNNWLFPDDDHQKEIEITKIEQKTILDFEAFVEELNGDKETALTILKNFVNGLETGLENIKKALANKEIDTLHRLAHSMKSGAQNVFASKLADPCLTLENKVKNNEDFEAKILIEEISIEIDQLKNVFKKYTL